MLLFLTFLSSFLILIFSVLKGYFVAYPLMAVMTLFTVVLSYQGFSIASLLKMAIRGSQKSFSVINVLLIIGAVTASWMASGTVPTLVYYGIQIINPGSFILVAFLLTSIVSLLIGTSFGTVSTIGIALMIMAKGGGHSHLVAGAIIAGAYVGDRCSPMSSSANLIAIITQTRLYTNIQNMWRTAGWALGLSLAIYAILSILNPVQIANQIIVQGIETTFQVHPLNLLPAIAILLLSIWQIEVKRSMLISIAVASAIALFYQHYSLAELVRFITLGFRLENDSPLQAILIGGGVVSMVKVSIVVILSTAFVGIFAGTRVLQRIEGMLERANSRSDRFLMTTLVGIGSAAFGCTQSIAILLTQQLVEPKYKENEKGDYQLALDLENTVVVLAPLIPWNIAGLVPATVLNVDAGFIPFAVFLYLLPLLSFLQLKYPSRPMPLCN